MKRSQDDGEDAFYVKQSRVRAALRISEGRAKALDLFVLMSINEHQSIFEKCEIILDVPVIIFNDLDKETLEQLRKDARVFLRVEGGEQLEFWRCVDSLIEDELKKLERMDSLWSAKERLMMTSIAVHNPYGLNTKVLKQIHELLSTKNERELLEMQKSAEKKLKSKKAVDVDYWETLKATLKVFCLRAKVETIYNRVTARRIEYLRARGYEDAAHELQDALRSRKGSIYDRAELFQPPKPATLKPVTERTSALDRSEIKVIDGDIDTEEIEHRQKRQKKPLRSYAECQNDALAEIADVMKVTQRAKTEYAQFAWDNSEEAEVMYNIESTKDLDSDEEVMDFGEIPTIVEEYEWADKHKPRKPRYFNRVTMGFEWTRYNKAHYTKDNPPPKMVMGYKFNIFYPELANKNTTPEYKLMKDPESKDDSTCLIKFIAGPPYEDLTFRIVNKEWDYAHWRGFKCAFERNVLQLWFKFRVHKQEDLY